MLNEDKHLLSHKSAAANDLGSYGLETMAYIKTVIVDGQKLHAIHAADGTQLTILSERDVAFATVRQHDLEPNSVH